MTPPSQSHTTGCIARCAPPPGSHVIVAAKHKQRAVFRKYGVFNRQEGGAPHETSSASPLAKQAKRGFLDRCAAAPALEHQHSRTFDCSFSSLIDKGTSRISREVQLRYSFHCQIRDQKKEEREKAAPPNYLLQLLLQQQPQPQQLQLQWRTSRSQTSTGMSTFHPRPSTSSLSTRSAPHPSPTSKAHP